MAGQRLLLILTLALLCTAVPAKQEGDEEGKVEEVEDYQDGEEDLDLDDLEYEDNEGEDDDWPDDDDEEEEDYDYSEETHGGEL